MEFIIPNEIDNIPVIALGGFEFGFADGFRIIMPKEYQINNLNDKAWITENEAIASTFKNDYPIYTFNIKLNNKIKNTDACDYNLYYSNETGDAIAYKIEVIFN